MLECTENCIYQTDGICHKHDCKNVLFESAVCPYFISADNKIKQIKNTSDGNDFNSRRNL